MIGFRQGRTLMANPAWVKAMGKVELEFPARHNLALLVMSELYPTKEALDAAGTGAQEEARRRMRDLEQARALMLQRLKWYKPTIRVTMSRRDFVVAVGNDDQWRRFCRLIGAEGLASDVRFAGNPGRVANYGTLRPRIAERLRRAGRPVLLAAMKKDLAAARRFMAKQQLT